MVPDGGSDQHEAGVLVACVIQSIEPSGDEGIIDGSDWNQSLAKKTVAKPGSSEQKHEVHFCNAQLDMLTLGCELPFCS